MTSTTETNKLQTAYKLLTDEHSSYMEVVGNTNEKLYTLLGQVYAFGQSCFKNPKHFGELLTEKKMTKASGENPWMPVVKLVFGKWITNDKDNEVWQFNRSAAPYAVVLRYFDWLDTEYDDIAAEIAKIGGIAAVAKKELKLREKANIPSKAKRKAEKKLDQNCEKFKDLGTIKTVDLEDGVKPHKDFVLLIGHVVDGEVNIKSFADAGESTIAAMINKTASTADRADDIADGSGEPSVIYIAQHKKQKELIKLAASA